MGVKTVIKKVRLSNGETIAYRERDGGDKNVLLIHGNMTSSKHWDLLINKLDPQYKLIAIDLRGFGESTYQTPIASIKDFADDVKRFVDEVGLEKFSLIGWSMGGAVAMQFVADYPSYCDKLVLLASASTRGYPFYGTTPFGQPDLNRRLKTLAEVKKDGKTMTVQGAYHLKNRGLLKATWNLLIYTKKQPSPEVYEEYIDDMLTQKNLAEVYQALNTFNISDQYNGLTNGSNQVKDIRIPTLVLRGDRDLVVNQQMTKEIIEDFGANARFVELKDCGHSPLVDDLTKLNQVITKFFEE